MVRRRRVLVSTLAALVLALLVAGGILAVDRARSSGHGDEARVDAGPGGEGPRTSTAPAPMPPVPGSDALVAVAVATLWVEPGAARPVDAPSLTNPVDIPRWLSTMSTADRLWLVERLATQALYGARVKVLEVRDDWARVVVTDQPSSLHPEGYPGWLPVVQLTGAPAATAGASAVVTTVATALRDPAEPSRTLMELSYATRLPVVALDGPWVAVATPAGTPGVLGRDDVEISDSLPGDATGSDLVDDARRFSGVPYLWAGTSAPGFDCSGLTWAVYAAHGIVIPRDAADQAGAGSPADPADLRPGDLLFYATGPERDTIHHVSMYVGDGRMIQSPATGKTVETVPVDTPYYARQFWGARRYLGA